MNKIKTKQNNTIVSVFKKLIKQLGIETGQYGHVTLTVGLQPLFDV